MISATVANLVSFQVLYVEEDTDRVLDFVQAFTPLAQVTVASPSQALVCLQQDLLIDLVIVNESLGGYDLLDRIDSARIRRQFATILLRADATTDTNVQPKGQPTIDVFPLDFDEAALHKRLTYLIQKKDYRDIKQEIDTVRTQRLPPGKRLFDIGVSSAVLLVISPILAIVAILIRLDSKGSIFYKSKRVGMGYRVFNMYKFRTMRTGADAFIASMAAQNMYQPARPEPPLDALCEACQGAGTPCQRPLFQDDRQVCEVQVQQTRRAKAIFTKFREDPRVTKFGQFLRNTSIDELPQLINILRGDMSFVGNRPLPPYEAEKLTTIAYARRFAAPAGLTGLWQVTKRGRSAVSDQERIQLDALYAKNYSFKTDMMILLRTVKAVFQKENV